MVQLQFFMDITDTNKIGISEILGNVIARLIYGNHKLSLGVGKFMKLSMTWIPLGFSLIQYTGGVSGDTPIMSAYIMFIFI